MTQLSAPVQILAVSGKQIPTQRGPSTIFEIKANDGREYSTFKEAVAQQANGLVGGQSVLLQYEESSNVKDGTTYTNYRLGDIIIPDGSEAAVSGIPSNPTVTSSLAPVALSVAPVAVPGQARAIPVSTNSPDEKDARIARSVAIKTAMEFNDRFEDALLLAPVIEQYILTGHTDRGSSPEPVQSPEPAQAGTTGDGIDW